jgi:hypothetical protein
MNNSKFKIQDLKLRKNDKYKFLSFILLLFTVYCLLSTVSAEAAELAGKITRIEGRVDILRAGAAVVVVAKLGDSVYIGDILRTKSDGRAEITFIDKSVMTLGPKSRLGIDEYLFKPEDDKRAASLKLYRGKSGFKVPKPIYAASGSKFEMKTRTAVAGVRGTDGILFSDGIERCYVSTGIVEFRNPLGSVVVTPGKVGEIMYGRAPIARSYSEKEFKRQEEGIKPTKAPEKKPEGERAAVTAEPTSVTQIEVPIPTTTITQTVLKTTTLEEVTTNIETTTQPLAITEATGQTVTNTDVTINANFPYSNVDININFPN